MSLPNKEGSYKARPLEWGVKTDGNPALVVKFDLLEYFNGTDWEDPGGDFQITGYFYPLKNDGSVNDKGVKSLVESLGWDGTFAGFANADFSQTDCQVLLGYEEYKGQSKIRVKFINPADSTPGSIVAKGDPQQLKSLDAQYGSSFRALGLKPKNPAPKGGAAPGRQAASPPLVDVKEARRNAWNVFHELNPDKGADEIAELWKAELRSLFPGREPAKLLSDDWIAAAKKFREPKVPAGGPPYGEEAQFEIDDIPF